MTNEDDLTQALRFQTDEVVVPTGDLAEIARRGQRRRRAQNGVLGGGLVAVIVAASVGVAAFRPGAETLVETAATAPNVTVALASSLVENAPIGDEKEDADEGAIAPVSRDPAELVVTTLLATPEQAEFVAATINAHDLCELGEAIESDRIIVSEMLDGTNVANVTCDLAAYQAADVRLFVIDASGLLTPVEVEWYGESAITSETVLQGFVDVLPEEDKLSVFIKFRGLGDCGIEMTHRWNTAASRFALETAHGMLECPVDIPGDYDPSAPWPQIYPSASDGEAAPPVGGPMIVPQSCLDTGLKRQAKDLTAKGVLLDCLKQGARSTTDATQFWVEDVIDVGDQTLVVWRASAFEGEVGIGTPWGFEEIHVTELRSWTDRVVRRIAWEDPSEADWMYAYRIEFAEDATLRAMIGWHQGECYWVDRMDFDGALVDYPANSYPRPATLDELAADLSLCEYSIEYEPQILAEVFSTPEALAYFERF